MAKTHDQAGFLVEETNGARSFFAIEAEAKKYAKAVNAVARPTVVTWTVGKTVPAFDGVTPEGEFQLVEYELQPIAPILARVSKRLSKKYGRNIVVTAAKA
jgi:hypothetical protein